MNTQKLIIILLGMNLISAIITGGYYELSYKQSGIEDEIRIGEDYTRNLKEEQIEVPIREGAESEATPFSSLSVMGDLTRFMITGLKPLPIGSPDQISDPVEQVIYKGVIWFKGIIAILLGLEIVLLWKNKKTK